MRWVLLGTLTALAGLAAVALAQRTKPSGRAELALTTCILWNALIGCPIYVLGLTKHLTPGALGVTSALLFTGALVAGSWRGSAGRAAREVAAGVVELIALPFEGIARAKRARSLVVLALLLSALLIVYTAVASYFTPSWRQWDSLWYHETIVGYAIQTHSLGPFDLPGDPQKVNGYPKLCELIQLWFVIFTDRRLIEVVNSLIAPGLMYATYVIARRYTRSVVTCMGWAAVVLLMPNTSYLLESTYIDVHVALFVVAATHYATRPKYRIVDAWLAALCITMTIGSKYLALPAAGIATLIAFVRLLRHHGLRLRSVATALGGFLLLAAMSASVFWRNWKYFKNPLWPDLDLDDPKHGIHLPSISYNGANPLDMNMSVKDLVEALLSVPYSVGGLGPKGQLYDYGTAVIWIVFPLGAVALLVILWLVSRDLVGRVFRMRTWRAPDAWNALLVALPTIAQIVMSPALWSGRYHIANVAVLACLAAFVGGRARWQPLGEGAAVAACVLSLVVFYWVKPRWYWLPSELVQLAEIPYPEREVTPASTISKTIDVHSGSSITREVGLEREKLKPGEIVAYADNVQFPALLWNNTFTNKLQYVVQGAGYFDRVNATGARWVYCRNADPDCAPFVAASTGPTPTWKDLGVYNTESWGRVYRRLTP